MKMEYNRIVISPLKRALTGDVSGNEVSNAITELGKAIDGHAVRGESAADLEMMYEDMLWLKCDLMCYEQA